MKNDDLFEAWDELDRSIRRLLVSQPSSMTEAAARVDAARLAFAGLIREAGRLPSVPTDTSGAYPGGNHDT